MGTPCKIRGKLRSKVLRNKEFPQKKVLSLVLCVAVMLSVMVMGAGAAFSDQDKIENTEAVNMCTALNIIGGYPDGSYKPEGNIKRSEITKMICVALNGGKEPNVSTNTTPTFSDVRGTNAAWAEGYIESCVAQGIISGVGGGRFSPNGNVTGTQLAKMLLVSLGYNANTEGFVGNAWATNVNVIASQKGLYEGLESMDTSAALTRDNAAQMVWNAMNAYEVEYKTTIITDENGKLETIVTVQDKVVGTNRDKITLMEDKYEAKTETGILSSVKFDDSTDAYTTAVTGVTDGTNGIGNIDSSVDYSDLMGQEVKVVYTKDKKTDDINLLGIYATDKNRTLEFIYDDAKVSGGTVTLDGKDYDITGIKTIATNGTVVKAADYDQWSNYPYEAVKLVDNDNDKVYEYAVVNPFKVAQLTSLTSKVAYFENALDDTKSSSVKLDELDYYTDMAEDDYVLLTEAAYSVSGNVVAVKADTISGKVDGTRTDDSILVDGTWYKKAGDSVTAPTAGDDLEYAVVANGFYFVTEGATGSADKLALVLKVGSQDFDGDYRDVKLLLSDGSTKTTKAYVKEGTEKNTPKVATLYTYTENSDGFVLKDIENGKDIGMDETVLSGAGGTVKYNSKTNKVGTTRLAADAKVFVLYDKSTDGTSYKGKLITGSDADKWADGEYWFTVAYTDGNVKILVASVGNKDLPNATDDSAYGVILSEPYSNQDEDGNDVWIVDSFLTESGVVSITVDAEEWDDDENGSLSKNALVSYKMDGSSYVEVTASPKGATAAVGAVTDVSGDYVTIKTTSGSVELKLDKDDSSVLYFDSDLGEEASGSIKKAAKMDNENYYANILVIYKGTQEADQSYIIWGAAVDVNNQLQDENGGDILISVGK